MLSPKLEKLKTNLIQRRTSLSAYEKELLDELLYIDKTGIFNSKNIPLIEHKDQRFSLSLAGNMCKACGRPW